MRKEKQNFWQRLKGAKMRILFSLGYFALLTASATALFFLVNIVRVSADGESRVILTTFDDRDKLLRLANVSVEELKQQLLQDTDFIQQIKKSVVVEEDAGKVIEEEQSDGMDMDEGMLMAGLSMFESGF